MPDRSRGSKREIREYYRTVGRFLDRELAGRNDAPYWGRRVEELGRPTVLDLGAGTGRVTRLVAPRAQLTVAVDLSEEMLGRARDALRGIPGVHLVLADMRELSLGRVFDLVLAGNDPFVHLASDSDRQRALAMAARHLRPGGLFILDALWLRLEVRRRASRPGGWHRERSLGGNGDELRVTESWTMEPDTLRGRVRYEYRDGERVVGRASFTPRLWSPEEVESRFESAGLRVRRMLGSYDEDPWDPRTASSFIVEAERGKA